MAWFTYCCPTHGIFRTSLPKRQAIVKCPICQTISPVILKANTIQIVERVDNGIMPRAVETLHNIDELMEQRDQKTKIHDNDIEDDEN